MAGHQKKKSNNNNNNNNNNQSAGAPVICHTCQKPGHMSKDCLSKTVCTKCGKTGHLPANCRSNNNNNANNNNNQNSQNNNNGGKYCNFCNFKGHTDAECRKNPANQLNNGTQNQNQNQYNNGFNQQQNVNQFPLNQGQAIAFSDPCQLCGQSTHYARDCPSRGLVPQTGQYFPQTYQPTSWPQAPAPPINNISWINQIQPQTQYPGHMDIGPELIGEEVSTRPPYPHPVQYAATERGGGYKAYYGYIVPEVACERSKLLDRDGDYIMGNAWECGECIIPPRQTDNLPWRWPIVFPQGLQRGIYH